MQWLRRNNTEFTKFAFVGGYEENGDALYVARTTASDGSIHPAKAGKHLNGVNYCYDSQEINTPNYQIFVVLPYIRAKLRWVNYNAGETIPEDAVVGGNEVNGNKLYIARVKHAGGLHIGKAGAHLDKIYIPYGSAQVPFTKGQILVCRDQF
eukprot:TRINITY_DN3_c2_g1_i1.p1 TRINITY_DN3_c2_g1~~TRINITY_DN3_c2_g1_i1.p1  ORF type:complete len:152 (-),score=72.95 TRINITY_DN3_c2_g1_i1:184-639(-)